jgi:hypothetical protein
MKYLRLFGYAAQTTDLLPLPSACLATTIISNPPITSINNSTLTYRGPLTDGFLTPFALTITTYTTTLTTLRADGMTETQTYTIFGAPVELTHSSSLSPSSTPTAVISPDQVGASSIVTSVAVSTTIAQPVSITSDLSQSSTQPQVCRIPEFAHRHDFHNRVSSGIYFRPMPITLYLNRMYGVFYHLLISLKILSTYIPLNDFVGCLEDTASNGQPLLYGPTAKKETQELCKAFCTTSSGGPYRYFGIGNGSNCHCGNSFLHPAVNHPGECNTGCSGNATEQCGGAMNRISLWQNSDWPLVRVFFYKLAVSLFDRRVILSSLRCLLFV